MTQRARGWCITLNNYSLEEVNLLEIELHSDTVEKYILGKEIGKDKKVPHLQGWIYFKNGKTLSAIKKLSDRAHWEVSKGTAQQNWDYCSKDGDYSHKGFDKKQKILWGGYSCEEEEVMNTLWIKEVKDAHEEDAINHIEYNVYQGEVYDTVWDDLMKEDF
uniref:CRESS-DNA virus Rep endonuclease domain-containing protein n=1 Tax=Antarctic circular DNA molecule TaxID=2664238 RepID=A0A5Q2F080_9ZZZZ|nr:hypothetical protein [Antarctic circular DNA molecule]